MNSTPPYEPLTAWAQRYGPWPNHSKSHLTPTPHPCPDLDNTYDSAEIANTERWQRGQLNGFTTRELANLDALCIRDIDAGSLDHAILPLIDRNKWEKIPPQPEFTRNTLYQMDGGGDWSMHNDEVWEMMKPVLRLATRYLLSASSLPWVGPLDRYSF